jgi:DNA-binding NtrC family response regulator
LLGNKSKIIAVEPDAAALKDLEAKLAPYHIVVGTTQPERALALLQSEREAVAILVSTSKGSDVLGVLAAAQQQRPNVLRVLLTAFENLTVVVEGLHSGAVQRVVSRPIQYAELLAVVRAPNDGTSIPRSA